MLFLPYENFYVASPLKPEAIHVALDKVVAPKSSVGVSWRGRGYISEGYFMGYTVRGSFEFQQVLTYKNSFAPMITGTVTPHQDGSRIHIKMELLTVTKIFLAICAVFLIAATTLLLCSDLKVNHIVPVSFMPVGMLVFAYLITIYGFKTESQRATSYLVDLFAGEIE